ncbi:MAG TPA: SCE4755 family polysaccharide monooxygenase-like protein [Polyangiales bacterium]
MQHQRLSWSSHLRRSAAALALAAVGALTLPAQAHIIMEGELKGREGDQKAAPCEGLPRSETPNVFEPGATIRLAVIEGIPHDGYFRISFDDDGTDFKDPGSIKPFNPNRYGPGKACEGTPQDHCGESDFCNMVADGKGPRVLWDKLDLHLGADVSFGQVREWHVKLPDIECENCTIQVMQVMEDPAGHGPFDGMSDLYYRCVDVVLRKGAGNTPGTVATPITNDGIECGKSASPAAPDAGAGSDAGAVGDAGAPGHDGGAGDASTPAAEDDDGGCSVYGPRMRQEAPSLAWLLLLGTLGWRARLRMRRG